MEPEAADGAAEAARTSWFAKRRSRVSTYFYVSLDSVLVEGVLEDLVVLDVLVVELSSPLHLREIERAWVDGIHDLAVHGSRGALLDLGELKLQERVSE